MIPTHSRLGGFMQYRIDIGNGNLLVFEDDNDKTLRVMVVDLRIKTPVCILENLIVMI